MRALAIVLVGLMSGGLQDLFWCPMHPDVRSRTRDKCPICAMELVPIPPPTLGHYHLEVTQLPRPADKGLRGLHIAIRHPQTSAPVIAFSELHERLLHLFIISRDLSYFAHLHPVQSGSAFEVAVDLDPGAYVLIADFAPSGGTPQLVQHAIVTPGYTVSPFTSARLKPDPVEKVIDGLRVSLDANTRPLKPSLLRFSLRDAVTNEPLTDLEPFLGASGHLLVVNSDATIAIHAHPEGPGPSKAVGPEIVFAPTLPEPGVYKAWAQFQRRGQVVTAPFVIEVR